MEISTNIEDKKKEKPRNLWKSVDIDIYQVKAKLLYGLCQMSLILLIFII